MTFNTQITNNLLDLEINNQLRTQVKIDLEKLYSLVQHNQSIENLVKNLEMSFDIILVQLLENFNQLTLTQQKDFLNNLKKDYYNCIFDNFEGINHEQEMEKTNEEVYLALNYFKDLQKKRDLVIDDFIIQYRLVNNKIIRKL